MSSSDDNDDDFFNDVLDDDESSIADGREATCNNEHRKKHSSHCCCCCHQHGAAVASGSNEGASDRALGHREVPKTCSGAKPIPGERRNTSLPGWFIDQASRYWGHVLCGDDLEAQSGPYGQNHLAKARIHSKADSSHRSTRPRESRATRSLQSAEPPPYRYSLEPDPTCQSAPAAQRQSNTSHGNIAHFRQYGTTQYRCGYRSLGDATEVEPSPWVIIVFVMFGLALATIFFVAGSGRQVVDFAE